ncbi:hypothetical protein C8R45DRAFT_1112780 [Mycena sanguinolenta]|nr:hypothetical protein C8R45DRAFT_1112780 [Mycena sanguinolenta]
MDGGGNDSPPLRSTILGSFLGRGRPRNSSQSHIDVHAARAERELSPGPSPPASPVPFSSNSMNMNSRRRTGNGLGGGPGAGGGAQAQQVQAATSGGAGGLSLGGMLRRRRSAGNMIPATPVGAAPPVLPTTAPRTAPIPAAAPPADHHLAPGTGAFGHLAHLAPGAGGGGGGGTHRIRLVPHLDSRRSLRFDPISRDLKPGEPALRIGRFTDRSGLGLAAVNALSTNKIAFKSKVVSRAHAEVWIEEGGAGGAGMRFLIRDTKSSSGTFLNHVRLSAANTESRPHSLKDGDILQLGVDYQGGAEDIYKSVKIRVEIGREWQREANAFK